MADQKAKKKQYAQYVFGIWLGALAVFLVLLVISLWSGPSLYGPVNDKQLEASKRRAALLDREAKRPELALGYVYENLPPEGSLRNPDLKFEAGNEYVLVGAAVQGFFQTSDNISAWALPARDFGLSAQLIRRGHFPRPITEKVKLEWEVTRQPNEQGKTGDTTETGATASANSAASATLKGEMHLGPDGYSYSADIPHQALLKDGFFNPYTVVAVRALNEQGSVLAESAAVVAVSPGFACSYCHEDPELGVLQLHDRRMGTDFKGMADSGTVVECSQCHSGPSVRNGKLEVGAAMSLSAAIHGWHAAYLGGRGQEACLSCHIGLGRSAGEDDSKIRPLFMRDLHQQRGLSCVRCHGVIEDHALSLLLAEKEAGQAGAEKAVARLSPQAVESATEIKPRLAWVQEPDCAGCHDFQKKPRLDTASAFNKWTEKTDGPEKLFGRRTDNSTLVRCVTCHGAPHAVYPARNPVSEDRDNLPAQQYQQDSRVLGGEGNCAVCHQQPMNGPMLHHNVVWRGSTLVHVPDGAMQSMPRVRFSHDAHGYEECSSCHHTGREDGKSLLCTSSGCHDAPVADQSGPDQNGAGSEYRFFYSAFHDGKYSCQSCHEARQREFQPGGPTDCNGCHRAPSDLWSQAEKAEQKAEASGNQ